MKSGGKGHDGTINAIEMMTYQPVTPAPQGWTSYLLFCNLSVVLGASFMFGYNLAVVNGPYDILLTFFHNSLTKDQVTTTPAQMETTTGLANETITNVDMSEASSQFTLAITLYLIGGLVGSTWFPSIMADKIGKKRTLIVGAIIAAIGEAIIFISPFVGSHIPFMIGRAIVGLQAGLGLVLSPALINEHAPGPLRGVCGGLIGIGLAVGLQLANLLALPFVLGQEHLWHYLFLVAMVLFLGHIALMFFVVEGPRWLIDHNKPNEALNALGHLRCAEPDAVRPELEEIKKMAADEAKIKAVTIAGVFRERKLWWPMLITINLHISNELTGLSAVLIFASVVMKSAGFDPTTAAIANFGLTFGVLLGNVISSQLVDRLGRRGLMLIGMMGVIVFNVFLVIVLAFDVSAACIAGFALFLILFSVGPGPIPWYMPAEMFTQASRPLALSVGVFTNWAGNIIVTFAFPIIMGAIGYYSFLPFAAIASLEFLFFLFFLPETSSKMANYSQDMFEPGNSLVQLRKK